MAEGKTDSTVDAMGVVLARTICLLEPFLVYMVTHEVYAETAQKKLGRDLQWWRVVSEHAFQRIAAVDEEQELTIEDMEVIRKNTVYLLRRFLIHMVMYEIYEPDSEEKFGRSLQRWRSLSERAFQQIEDLEVWF